MNTHRFFIEVAYKGTHYSGWQVQKNGISVQQKLNEAISTILNSDIEIQGASRTDTGVHASMNYGHFDFHEEIPKNFLLRINLFLPQDIAVKKIIPVEKHAHVRFNAFERSYEYYIHFEKNPFLTETSYHFTYGKLDVPSMNEAAHALLKYRDFSAFSKAHTQVKTNDCKMKEAVWVHNKKTGQLVFCITANRFLRGMVKGIVGTSLLVGRGKITVDEFRKIIENKNRAKADFSAPPHGLFLSSVRYRFI